MEGPTLVGIGIAFLVALWVGKDANERYVSSWSPFLWFFAVLALLIVFLPLYLFTRPPKLKKHREER